MKLAVLPFNAAEGTSPALGRQLSNFASDTVRASGNVEINTVSLLTQVEQEGVQRVALVNISEGLLEQNWITDLFTQSGCDVAMDGLLKAVGDDSYELTVRFHLAGQEEPIFQETYNFGLDTIFPTLRKVIVEIAKQCEAKPDEGVDYATMDFGTDDPQVFLKFL